jgi:glutathione S-transferase
MAELAASMHVVANEARSIEARLARSNWVVGESFTAADIVIFPALQALLRALHKPEGAQLSSRFLPLEVNYPALARWIARVEALPGYERTYPPHWR